jgi:hypothetical protein
MLVVDCSVLAERTSLAVGRFPVAMFPVAMDGMRDGFASDVGCYGSCFLQF